MKKYLYTPAGLDPKAYFTKADDQYKAAYLLHQIEAQRVLNRRHRGAFTQLHSQLLRKQLGRYDHVLRELIRLGVVVPDNQYVVGCKCKGYRLADGWQGRSYRRAVATGTRTRRHTTPVHKWLSGWLERVELDCPDSLEGELALQFIRDRQFFYKPDQYGRVHTNLTNLLSDYRQYLRIDGQGLVSYDIVNSQPYFLFLLYVSESNTTTPYIHYVARRTEMPADVKDYATLVTGGNLYEALLEANPSKDRAEVKEELFRRTLFGKGVAKSFAKRFPTLAAFIRHVKKKDHRRLSHMLQRLESRTVIHTVADAIRRADAQLPLVTIHDCFATTVGRSGDLSALLGRQFAAYEYPPTLREERWHAV